VQYNNGCPDGIDIQFSNHEYDTNHGIYYLGYNIMGQRTGTDYYFYPDSKIKEEDKKLTDTLNMPRFRHISWYENGRIKNEYNYTLGKHTHDNPFYYLQKDAYGIVKGWYENGKIKDIGEWENNKLVGLWKYYDSNGKLRKITSYDTNKNTEEVMRYNEHGELLNQKSIKNKQELKKYLVGTWISIEDSNHIVRITNDSVIDISHSEFCIHYFPYRITDTACCSHTKGYSKSIKYFIGEAHPELVNLTPSCVGVTYIDMNYLDLTILDLYDNDAGLCLFFKRKQDTVKGK
jgi:antitoxin component YwqK of YwqJK toxin-antitoxin module